jgi:hypothetical protein
MYVCRLSRTTRAGIGYERIHIALRAIDRLQFRTWAATSCERNRGYLLIILNEGYTPAHNILLAHTPIFNAATLFNCDKHLAADKRPLV